MAVFQAGRVVEFLLIKILKYLTSQAKLLQLNCFFQIVMSMLPIVILLTLEEKSLYHYLGQKSQFYYQELKLGLKNMLVTGLSAWVPDQR